MCIYFRVVLAPILLRSHITFNVSFHEWREINFVIRFSDDEKRFDFVDEEKKRRAPSVLNRVTN